MKKKPNGYWTQKTIQEEADRHTSRKDFAKNNPSAYNAAWKKGKEFLDIVCSHMDTPTNKPRSNEEIRIVASKYFLLEDFRENEVSTYTLASSRDLLKEICSHMKRERLYRTDEELQTVALLYLYRSDFQKYDRQAYESAWNRGNDFLDKVCSHMKPSNGSSDPEREILAITKNYIPTAKKFRDGKVKIEGKPYIKGFEIDIFVPDLNLGIEFDGTRYHSFEYMRKDRRKSQWSDEDIRNYHGIKDGWFASKGIRILHVKQSDWIENKQNCIQECLKFLGIK
jgi:hypothetical protein